MAIFSFLFAEMAAAVRPGNIGRSLFNMEFKRSDGLALQLLAGEINTAACAGETDFLTVGRFIVRPTVEAVPYEQKKRRRRGGNCTRSFVRTQSSTPRMGGK